MLKVAVINTYQTGGAAIAKNRLIKAIVSTKKCAVSDLSRYHQKDGLTIDLLENLIPSSEEDNIISKYQRYLLGTQRTNLTNTFFSGEATSWDISNHPTIKDADLINLHWVSEMICADSLLSLAKQNYLDAFEKDDKSQLLKAQEALNEAQINLNNVKTNKVNFDKDLLIGIHY